MSRSQSNAFPAMSHHILVLGGTGFVGSAVVVRLLADDPDARLSMLVHRRPPGTTDPRARLLHGGLQDMDLDEIRRDPPSHVIHMARLPGSGPWRRRLAGLRGARANTRLIDALRRLPQPPRVVYVSGSLMYGDHGEDWVDESTPLHPISFARHYILGERPFLAAQEHDALPVMMVRPPWILGAASWFEAFYVKAMRRNRTVPCYGPGANWMSLLHVDDCAKLIRHVALCGEPGSNYNLCGTALRQRGFCDLLSAQTGLPVREVPLSRLRQRLDSSLIEAFGSSIRLHSRHVEFLRQCPLRFEPTAAAVADVLSRFEDIQRILSQAP